MENRTEGVDTILGDPRRAIRRLSVPMLVAMLSQNLYNLVDAIWVAGLGEAALAAVGMAFPFFFILTGIGNGIGVGAASAIARRLGANDKKGADDVASQSFALALIATVLVTIPMVVFVEDLFLLMGAEGDYLQLCVDYAVWVFGGTGVIFVLTLLDSVLRAEGDAKRSMRIMIIGSVLNIILDPIFIYTLNMGVAGAAIASILAFGIAMLVMADWFFVKKDTFIRFEFKDFKLKPDVIKEILHVGLPASLELTILSISSFIMVVYVQSLGGEEGMAIYSSGWRLLQMAMIPFHSIGAAVIPVCGAAFGGKRYDKLEEAYRYSVGLTVGVMVLLSVALAIFAMPMAALFTWGDNTAHLQEGIAEFVRIGCIFLPFIGMAAISSMMFQSIGRGMRALISTLLRNIFCLLPPIFILGSSMGLIGVWWGMVIGHLIGASIVLAWGILTVRDLANSAPLVRPVQPS